MKKTINLAIVLFKSSLNIKEPLTKKKQIGKIVLWIILAICIFPLIYFLYNAGHYGYLLFDQQNESNSLIASAILIISIGICITGISACINSMYFSSNNNALFVLPLRPTQIAGAKLIVATVYEYYLSFVVLAPFLVGYGIAAEKSLVFWFVVVVAVILLPIVPMACAGIISVVFMTIFKSIKDKNRMPVISGIAAILATILITIFSGKQVNMDVKSMQDVALHVATVLKKLTFLFPDIPFISSALTKQDLFSIIIAILIVVLVLFVFWVLAKTLYFSAAIGRTEKTVSKKAIDSDDLAKQTKKQNILKSYTIKELRMLMRDSSCIMQCFLICLSWPIILIVTALFSDKHGYEVKIIQNLISLSENNSAQFVFVLFSVVFAATLFAVAFNATAPTSISREGRGYMLIKQLPIPYKLHLKAKRNTALIISALGSTFYLIIGGIILIVIKDFPWWAVILGIAMNFFVLIILIDIQMIMGLRKAKLDWESESDIMGKNIAGVIMFLIGLALIGILSVLYSLKVADLTISPFVFGVGLIIVLILLTLVVERILYSYGSNKMESLS